MRRRFRCGRRGFFAPQRRSLGASSCPLGARPRACRRRSSGRPSTRSHRGRLPPLLVSVFRSIASRCPKYSFANICASRPLGLAHALHNFVQLATLCSYERDQNSGGCALLAHGRSHPPGARSCRHRGERIGRSVGDKPEHGGQLAQRSQLSPRPRDLRAVARVCGVDPGWLERGAENDELAKLRTEKLSPVMSSAA